MGGERGVIEETSDGLGGEVNRDDFLDDDAKSFASAKRYFYDMSGAE